MQNKKSHSKKPKKFFNALKWILIVLLALNVLGFVYEQVSEYIDAKTLKAPGKMIQVGDHKMHIYCTGENKNGSPTVILEAGGGMNYTTWHRVQPEISKYTKVCSYDRSGIGFSDGTKDERTNDDVVTEFETLLKNDNVGGPYIMVGHSVGGFYTRLFTKRNIDQVRGLIQIDPSVEQMAPFMNEETPLIVSAQSNIIELLFRIGVARIVMHINPSIANIDKDIANTQIAFSSVLYKDKNKYGDMYKAFDNITEIERSSGFGNLPVVIFSASLSGEQGVTAYGEQVKNWHPDLAKRLSNNSKYIMVDNSSHFIQQDQSQVVIDAINGMLK
ncbi:MAG: alpha/beta hydrolase [bacterium]